MHIFKDYFNNVEKESIELEDTIPTLRTRFFIYFSYVTTIYILAMSFHTQFHSGSRQYIYLLYIKIFQFLYDPEFFKRFRIAITTIYLISVFQFNKNSIINKNNKIQFLKVNILLFANINQI